MSAHQDTVLLDQLCYLCHQVVKRLVKGQILALVNW